MLHLMNSSMMPQNGRYEKRSLDLEGFREVFLSFQGKGNWKSYVGYPETAKLLSRMLGVYIPVSREDTKLRPGDLMLVARLKRRLFNPADKSKNNPVSIDDFELSVVNYRELPIIPVIT